MILKIKIIFFSFTILATGIRAQNIDFKVKYFPEKKKEFKIVRKNLFKGEKVFEEALSHCKIIKKSSKEDIDKYCPQARLAYKKALKYFLPANEFNLNNAKLNFKIGVCYLYSSSKEKALQYFEKALILDSLVDPRIYYLFARTYHLNMDFDNAIREYENYRNSLSSKMLSKERGMIFKKIQECKSGRKIVTTPERVFVDNLGKAINSPHPDYSSFISQNDEFMVFTSRRESLHEKNIDPYDNIFFEDIYISYYDNKKWTSPKPFFTKKPKGHLSSIGLSQDGKQFLIYKGNKGNGDIVVSKHMAGEWQKPSKIPGKINTKYHESSACFTKNADTLYFISDMKNGMGGRDIYFSTINEKGKWNKPVNLGSNINTVYNEESVFLLEDGKTIYFSSQGHNSFGGYDIFKSVYESGKWSQSQNLGYPINSPENDLFFSINSKGTRAYMTSSRDGGLGEKDIYMVHYLGPEKPLEPSSRNVLIYHLTNPISKNLIKKEIKLQVVLHGNVTDDVTNEPVSATLELWDNDKGQIVSSIESNTNTGYYSILVVSNINYGLVVNSNGYLIHSEIFTLIDSANYFEITKNIKLKKAEVGTKIVLKNIFFDFNKSTLTKESFPELDKLAKLLNETPGLIIEISGHTDDKGSDKYNLKLSQSRAKSVMEYLTKVKEIDKSRVTYKGYGESQPIATNATDEGRQQNRRTEFKILKIVND